MSKITLFDGFAGIGGIRLGFELAHKDFKTIYAIIVIVIISL